MLRAQTCFVLIAALIVAGCAPRCVGGRGFGSLRCGGRAEVVVVPLRTVDEFEAGA